MLKVLGRGEEARLATRFCGHGWKKVFWFVAALSLLPLSPCRGTSKDGTAAADVVDEALVHRHNLEYRTARHLLDSWLSQHPDDPRALNVLGTVILHGEMFARGILERHFYGELDDMFGDRKVALSPGFEQELFGVLARAEQACENRLKQYSDDQEALYWAGSAHSTRAVYYYTMAKSYRAALREASEARKYHAQLLKLNPNYVDALLVLGINDYVAGSLPWYLKVLASLAGYRGNRTQGIEKVKRVTEQGHWAREDAKFILAMFYQRQKRVQETLQVLIELGNTYPRNFLVQRAIARAYQIQGDWERAAKVYDALLAKLEAHDPADTDVSVAKIFYEAGQIYARLGEDTEALARYEAAGRFSRDDIFVYRADLAAAELYLRLNRREEARQKYQRVAETIPNTNEGRAARRALSKMLAAGGESEPGSR